MDAEKWGNAFDRTVKKEGFKQAAKELFDGMLREIQSRADRRGRHTDPADVVGEVEELYREVAEERPVLDEDGFMTFLEEKLPEVAAEVA